MVMIHNEKYREFYAEDEIVPSKDPVGYFAGTKCLEFETQHGEYRHDEWSLDPPLSANDFVSRRRFLYLLW
jgi:hypothetical protein